MLPWNAALFENSAAMTVGGGGGGSPVTLDAYIATPGSGSATALIANNNLTIGSHPNLVLVCALTFTNQSISGLTVQWDYLGTPQSLSQICAINSGTSTFRAELWGMVNPTVGNKQIRAIWTGSSGVSIQAMSFYNASQVGGATTFPNSATNAGHVSGTTLSITNPTNGLALDVTSNVTNVIGTPAQTLIAKVNAGAPIGNSYSTVAGVVPFSWTTGGIDYWVEAGTAIAPA